MKLDRLLGIVVILLSKSRVPAKELAETFEVSVRTIYRDIETINLAGIPIITYQGTNGGIGIAEGYKLDRNLLTNNELAAIVSALKSINVTYSDVDHQILLQKLQSTVPQSHRESFNSKIQQIFIDLSPWGIDSKQKEKMEHLKQAIEEARTVTFLYRNVKGETAVREVEPHTLVLKGQKWYLYAYCLARQAFRIFKLARITEPVIRDMRFIRREVDLEQLPWDTEWRTPSKPVRVVLRFAKDFRSMAEEIFGVETVRLDEEERSIVEVSYPDDYWLHGLILSFGDSVEVLSPLSLRLKIKEIAGRVTQIYEQ